MKIKTKKMAYEKVMALPRPAHRKPIRTNLFWQTLIQVLSLPTLKKIQYSYETHGMEKIGKKEPVLILMNHSSFTDMKLASGIFYPRKYGIVTTTDAFVGMQWLMRLIGCIPTQKFVNDVTLIRDMEYLLKEKKTSVLMYPEAGYSFDGRATALPRKMGVLLKKLGVPVVTIITQGAFARDPLYNMLQIRKVKVSAHVKCLATAEEIKEKTVAELDALLDEAFSFDNFAWQRDNKVSIDVPFRADGLHRILYKCPHCGAEGKTEGKGIHLTCKACGKKWEMDEFGQLAALEGETEFSHIPDWYSWERSCVRKELEEGTYLLDEDVDIAVQVNLDGICMIGRGHLRHDQEGFHLTSDDGKLDYHQSPVASHTLYADYYWYELGDIIGIGNNEFSYFCFPDPSVPVSKARLATEELYKLKKQRRRAPKAQ